MKGKLDELRKKKSALDNLFGQISKIIAENNLKESDEPVLVDLINKIKELGLQLQDLVGEINKLESQLKDLLQRLGGLGSENSLAIAEQRLSDLEAILEGLNEDLNKLTKLTKKIEPEATDEEGNFIDQTNKDLTNLKKNHKAAQDSIKKARILLKQVKENISKKQKLATQKPADVLAIQQETQKMEDRLTAVTAEVKEVQDGVQRKKDGYNNMNKPAKLERRQKQLDEVNGYIGEVEGSIKELLTEIDGAIVGLEENKAENKDTYAKYSSCRDSTEKCNKLLDDLKALGAEIQEDINTTNG